MRSGSKRLMVWLAIGALTALALPTAATANHNSLHSTACDEAGVVGGGALGTSPGPVGPPNTLGWDVGSGQCNGSFTVSADDGFPGGGLELGLRAEQRRVGQVAQSGPADYTVQTGPDVGPPAAHNRAWWNFQGSIGYGGSLASLDGLTLSIRTDVGPNAPAAGSVDLLALRSIIDDRNNQPNPTTTYADLFQFAQNPEFGWFAPTSDTDANPTGAFDYSAEGAWKLTLTASEAGVSQRVSICIHTPEASCTPDPLRARKQVVRDGLQALLPTGDRKDDKRIEKAIEELDDSLDPDLWVDEDTLVDKDGKDVFKAEEKAVKELAKVGHTDVSAAIAELVAVDEALARGAIASAEAVRDRYCGPGSQGDTKDCEKAEQELAKAAEALQDAAEERQEGDWDKAIGDYRKAWERAQKALDRADQSEHLVDLQLLAFNDYHGHVQASTPGTINGAPAGGGEYLSAALTDLRAGHANSLTVAAGDLIGGSPAFSGLFHDEPSVETLNAMGLDVSSVGNHEFDEGVTELLRMQHGGCHPADGCYFPSAPYPGADFSWLAANVVEESTGQTPLPPYWIDEVDGIKVGFIGMTLEATDTLVAAAGIQGYDFLDEAETANALVPVLRSEGVKAIIVLLHEGGSQTPPPGDIDACVGISGPIVAINAALDPAIDAVVTGHTHLPYSCRLDDAAGLPRIVTSAYSFGRVVSEVNLVLDERTDDVWRSLSTATNHVVAQADLTPDPAITAILDKWQPLFDASGNTPVGTITADINRGGIPTGTDRGVESPAGNLVADAQLWATSSNGAQIAFMNPGGVRSDLTYAQSASEGDGVVTFGEAFTFQPFGNTLVTFPMTGAQIISVLEEQCQPAGSSRPFLHLGVSQGLRYDLAKTISGGPDVNCTSVTISNVTLNGTPLAPGSLYNVTVSNFLADGGDKFATFATITAPRLDGGSDLQALTNYLGTFSPVAPPPIDRVNEL